MLKLFKANDNKQPEVLDERKQRILSKPGFLSFVYRNKKGLASFASIIAGFFVSCIVIGIMGYNPFDLMDKMFTAAFESELGGIWSTIQTFAMLTVLGVAVAIGFKAGIFNIGIAGQMVFAAMCGYLFVQANPDLDPAVMVIAVLFIAILAAVAFGLVAGILKAMFGVHEVITTIMLNWIAVKITYGLMQKDGMMPVDRSTNTISLPSSFTGTLESMSENITWILFAAIAAVIVMFVVFKYTKLGMKIKIAGNNMRAGKYAGYKSKRIIIGVMVVSAAIAGLVAVSYFFQSGTHLSQLGHTRQTSDFQFPPEIGFVGIAVALVALNNPLAIAPVAFLFAILQGDASQGAFVGGKYDNFGDVAKLFGAIIVYFVAISNLFIQFITIGRIKSLYKRISEYYKNETIKVNSKVLTTIFNILSLGIYTYALNNWVWVSKLREKKNEENTSEVANV